MTHKCRKCGHILNDDNWSFSCQKNASYICKECQREQSRLWYKKNSDKKRAYGSLWQKANPDKVNAKTRLWRNANPDKARAQYTRASRKRGQLPMSKNKDCTSYLGVHIVEGVLGHVFKDVEVMPYGNPGYDVVCNKGKKIDFKGSCLHKNGRWSFHIGCNTIADYFLFLAFDNIEDLNPLHVWLIPGDVVNHLTGVGISPSTVSKWDMYKLDVDNVINCCDVIRGK